jgi:hypothetical protein
VSHVPTRIRVQLCVALGLLIASSTGCVERRYTIRTDPPGALAVVNGEEIGATPVSRSFAFYNDRKITLLADGYQPMEIIQPVKAPWYDNIFTEFFSENLVPVTIRDEREFYYKLTPVSIPESGDLVGRAEGLRAEAQVTPPPTRGGILGFFGF